MPMKFNHKKHYRKEKICLNCGHAIELNFCSECGQENIEVREPFWILFGEGISDFFHFDSKFSRTLIPLFIHPGFLTKEYLIGRRARYVHPVRLYFFVSVLMLLISGFLFSRFDYDKVLRDLQKASEAPESIKRQIQFTKNSNQSPEKKISIINALQYKLDSLNKSRLKDSLENKEEIDKTKKNIARLNERINFWKNKKTDTLARSDSLEDYQDELNDANAELSAISLSKQIKKPKISNYLNSDKQATDLKKILSKDGPVYRSMEDFVNHNLKIYLVILLPIFGLFLKFLYRRNKIYYQDHLINMLHLQSFIILFLSIWLCIPAFWSKTWPWVSWIAFATILIYTFLDLKQVYGQGYIKTGFKTIIFLFLCLLTLFMTGALYFTWDILHKYREADPNGNNFKIG